MLHLLSLFKSQLNSSYDDIISAAAAADDDFFTNEIQALKHRCTSCLDRKRDYVEK